MDHKSDPEAELEKLEAALLAGEMPIAFALCSAYTLGATVTRNSLEEQLRARIDRGEPLD